MLEKAIEVSCEIKAPVERVWRAWTSPEHIVHWNAASQEWHTPRAENDLREGGRFSYRMEARDGSMGFDFAGEHLEVRQCELVASRLDDGRTMEVAFVRHGDMIEVVERFEPDPDHPADPQRQGWQRILNTFKRYVEALEEPDSDGDFGESTASHRVAGEGERS